MEELMARYLANELSEAEKADFEQRLTENNSLSEEFEQMLQIWHEVQGSDDMAFNTNKAWDSVSVKLTKPDSKTYEFRPRYTFLKIAATLIMVLTAGYFLSDYAGILDSKAELIELVAEGSFEEYQLPDGTLIKLKSNSTITYEVGFGEDHRNLILKGGADFDVVRDERLPFSVSTEKSIVKVLGTSFDLSAYPEKEVELNVREGLVNFTNKDKKDLVNEIRAGQRAIMSEDGSGIITDNVVNDNYAAWWTGKLVFEATPLSEVIEDLENTFSVEIELNGGLGNCALDATYTSNSIKEIIETIQATFVGSEIKVTYQKENSIILDGKACTN